MSGGFQANPEGLITKGKAVTSVYEGYSVQKSKIYEIADVVAKAWTGPDCAKYVEAIHSYEEDFKKLGVVLAQIGEILERHGIRLAQSRDSIASIASRL